MILANPWVLRLRLEKQQAKPVQVRFPVTTPVMIVLPQAHVRFARAAFSSVRAERRCWLRCGAHKGPIAQT